MTFKDPWVILFIPIIAVFFFWYEQKRKQPGIRFSSTDLLAGVAASWKVKLSFLPFVLRMIVLFLFLIALAGPRSVLEETIRHSEGIDIVLVIDSSGSMAAEDFKLQGQRLNRLDIVKNVVEEFISARPHDRLGLVAFAAKAYTVCPLTTDHDWLIENLRRITLGVIREDGTAIGSGIASAVSRLKKSDAKSKVIILLTDGVHNAGKIDPLSAAQMAQALGIKIYTIGAGSRGYAPFPVVDLFGRRGYQNVLVEIDEKTLLEIAQITGGMYFRATDTESLRRVYEGIDLMEKTKIEEHGFKEYKQLFPIFLTAALVVLLLEIVLSNTLFLKIP